ncbi:hypothetical protein [Klebsiella grimontii]|uniref:hypothetical protein n=1 Tax=Klebsiella grimontii TaxID=2058152 RepID=UPI0012B98534|nr:hypothetical protein [Klebsiella grimontii]
MITVKYTLSNGIELPAAVVVLRTATLYSHWITTENNDGETITTEQKDIACLFSVFSSVEAFNKSLPAADTVEDVYPYDSTQDFEQQCYKQFSLSQVVSGAAHD